MTIAFFCPNAILSLAFGLGLAHDVRDWLKKLTE
jgi:hypothetical protein